MCLPAANCLDSLFHSERSLHPGYRLMALCLAGLLLAAQPCRAEAGAESTDQTDPIASQALGAHLGEEQEHSHAFVLEAAATTEETPTDGINRTGLSVGIETTVIPEWLEAELTGAALGQSNNREYSAAFLLKVPFRLLPKLEVTLGVGAFLSHVATGPNPETAHGRIGVIDLVFWPTRYLGWYLEASSARAASTQERAFGLSAGLMYPL